jgi:hypothetical protein
MKGISAFGGQMQGVLSWIVWSTVIDWVPRQAPYAKTETSFRAG